MRHAGMASNYTCRYEAWIRSSVAAAKRNAPVFRMKASMASATHKAYKMGSEFSRGNLQTCSATCVHPSHTVPWLLALPANSVPGPSTMRSQPLRGLSEHANEYSLPWHLENAEMTDITPLEPPRCMCTGRMSLFQCRKR